MAAAQNSFTPPELFEEYRLIRPLGQGAMGQVYLAHDTLLDRPVAIKFIAAVEPGEAARKQFFTEARAIARLSHANVVAIYRVGELSRRPYLVSEFVRGESLDRVKKPVPWQRALSIGIGLSRGLAAAHRRGVLHRDIKPANVMLAQPGDGGDGRAGDPFDHGDHDAAGQVKLLDFGLAKLLDPAALPVVPGLVGPPPGDGLAETLPRPDDRRRRAPAPPAVPVQRDDEVVGSPLYMAPEIWRGEPGTQQADVYSLGTLLYELCAGQAPHHDTPLGELPRRVQEVPARPLHEVAPAADARLCDLIDRCLRRDPRGRFPSGDALREALEQLVSLGKRGALPVGDPYPGLQSFDAEHRSLFFGRDAEVRALLDRLRSDPLVLVAGDSGVGKSSLCRAGVLEALSEAARAEGHALSRVTLSPGRHPLGALCNRVFALLPAAVIRAGKAADPDVSTNEDQLMLRLVGEPGFLAHVLRKRFRALHGGDGAERLVLFVDQMEELVALSDPDETGVFCEVLAALCECGPGVRVLGTVRSDFLTRLTALPGIGGQVGRALHLISPLNADELREAIVEPARVKGYRFETPAMVETLVSAGRTPGGLPLLQFALQKLWEARGRKQAGDLEESFDPNDSAHGARLIPASVLQAMGGVEGALARHADEVLFHLLPPQREAARRLLGKLVTAEGTRQRRGEAELCGPRGKNPDAQAALDSLVRGRILQVRAAEEGGGSVYELSHEALLTGWGTLRGWLGRDAELRALRQRLERAVAEWQRLGRAPELLWGDLLLDEVQGLDPDELAPAELLFLQASRRAARRGRLWRWTVGVGVPLAIALIYGGLRVQSHREISKQAATHLREAGDRGRSARERAQRFVRQQGQAFALFDGRHREQAESVWQGALALAEQARNDFAGAAHELETALVLDPGHPGARDLFGDVLYDWALHEERERHLTARDEILQRLSLYDDGGARLLRWREPARVAIATRPPGARVSLLRVVQGDLGQRIEVPASELGDTPIGESVLEPGSYILVLSAPGKTPVRYPALLARGEKLHIAVDLPAAADIPAGFVYVPAGRFLFGSGSEEMRRTFFDTVPLHEVHTGAYLIARNETTFADWLGYLRTLPEEERKRRSPRVTTGFQGWVNLVEREDGVFELEMKPSTRTYTARVGEPIRYGKRRHRQVQDWLRFPVSGISFEDAEAYVKWLDGSGRVRGARLCSEYEWERAARGADERIYPHGDHVEPDDANLDKTYGRDALGFGPDQVGSHPASRSPFGVDDLLGNVWEWTRSSLSDMPVVRGGSYYYAELTCSSVNRQESSLTFRDATAGLRVCASYPAGRPDK